MTDQSHPEGSGKLGADKAVGDDAALRSLLAKAPEPALPGDDFVSRIVATATALPQEAAPGVEEEAPICQPRAAGRWRLAAAGMAIAASIAAIVLLSGQSAEAPASAPLQLARRIAPSDAASGQPVMAVPASRLAGIAGQTAQPAKAPARTSTPARHAQPAVVLPLAETPAPQATSPAEPQQFAAQAPARMGPVVGEPTATPSGPAIGPAPGAMGIAGGMGPAAGSGSGPGSGPSSGLGTGAGHGGVSGPPAPSGGPMGGAMGGVGTGGPGGYSPGRGRF